MEAKKVRIIYINWDVWRTETNIGRGNFEANAGIAYNVIFG
mgnify:CR=1 FL=1